MPKKHLIQLSAEEQKTLDSLLNKGKISARVLKRAHILRLVAAGKSDAEIETALGGGGCDDLSDAEAVSGRRAGTGVV